MRRRTFLRKTMAATTVWFAQKAFPLQAKDLSPPSHLTIMHTNDMHGFTGRYVAGLKQMVAEIRRKDPYALLFDIGGFLPGGEHSLSSSQVAGWMKEIGYSAITFGHQEMKAAIGRLSQQFNCVNIPIVLSKRGGWVSECESVLNPFQIIEAGAVRVGVMGIGDVLAEERSQWSDIVSIANDTANLLKEGYRCDFVVCLSRLGFCYADGRPSDLLLAESSRQIDLILGGGTHTFMQEAQQWPNACGSAVWVSHAGFGGRLLGRLDLSVMPGGKVQLMQSAYLPVYSATVPIS